ncbi:MAG TPA: hypothetical protein VI248_10665 [Kineosporiaceae bacterium]
MRVTRNRATLAGIFSLAAGVLGLLGSQALPAFADDDYHHELRIAIDPIYKDKWSADATLYDRTGREVYRWHESHKSGNYVEWTYHANPGDTLDVSMWEVNGSTTFSHIDANRSYCYLLNGAGVFKCGA